jgi:peptidoglycan hydrolase-like protein with peptidoglycan-binding domain
MKKYIMYLLLIAVLVPSLAFASFDVSLKYGSHGVAVRELQDFLKDQGIYHGAITGNFFAVTRTAVKTFQKNNGLKADGYFGLSSRNKANEILASDAQASDDAEKAETGSVAVITPVPIYVPPIVQNPIINSNPTNNIMTNEAPSAPVSQKKIVLEVVSLDPMHPYRGSTPLNKDVVVNAYIYDDAGNVVDTAAVVFTTPDDKQNVTVQKGNGGKNGFAFNIDYFPAKVGVNTISVAALGITQSIDIEVTEATQ